MEHCFVSKVIGSLFSVSSVSLWLTNSLARTNHRDTEAQRNQFVTDFQG